MDFFSAEDRARRRTRRLMALFVLAVAAMIATTYGGLVLALGAAARDPAAALWRPDLLAGVTAVTVAVVAGASLFKWSEMRSGGAAVAESVGARLVNPRTTDPGEQRLIHVVEEMAIASGVAVPAVYILADEPGINAFAAGHGPGDAAVTVTRGAIDKLTRDELQGVIGHEFSHILNGDMRMNMRLTAILFGILVIGLAGRGILYSLRFSAVGGSRRDRQGGGVAVVVGAGITLFIVGYAGYFLGRLIQAAVSRQREFLADASSIQFTRNPGGLTGALRKIGGYAIGSSIDAQRALNLGHFFFAQALSSDFGGLWATHPPLKIRIRAIDPAFDGSFVTPTEVVDVSRQPWSAVLPSASPPSASPPSAAPHAALVASAGTLTAGAVQGARSLLASLPERLRTAARSPHDAPVLLYGLLLSADPAVRARQRAAVASRAGADALHTLSELDPLAAALPPAARLPILQLSLPALRAMPAASVGAFAGLIDELVAIDGSVSPFDYALQKLVLRTLSSARAPMTAGSQIFSFEAVSPEINLVLSALARTSSPDEAEAARAFSAGAGTLRLLDGRLSLLPAGACTLEKLDAALERLATASGPIKQRLLTAAGEVVCADGVLLPAEVELLRAVAATLDVPLPHLGPLGDDA